MNLCVVSTYNGTKEDYLKLYESFKDDIAKYTDGFEMGFVRDGKVIIVANVTDEEKFYALFEDPRSKEFDAKFNNVDDVYKLEIRTNFCPFLFFTVPKSPKAIIWLTPTLL